MVRGTALASSGGGVDKSLLEVGEHIHNGVLGEGLGGVWLGEEGVDEAEGAHGQQAGGQALPDVGAGGLLPVVHRVGVGLDASGKGWALESFDYDGGGSGPNGGQLRFRDVDFTRR